MSCCLSLGRHLRSGRLSLRDSAWSCPTVGVSKGQRCGKNKSWRKCQGQVCSGPQGETDKPCYWSVPQRHHGSSRFLSYGALGPRLMLQSTCSFWEMVTSCSNDTGFYVWLDILFILKFKLGNRSIKLFSWSNDKYNLASYTSNFRH